MPRTDWAGGQLVSIRVISGTAKGRRLKLVPGDSTRPIMDSVKENLFNILGRGIVGTHWLDLFAGTGSVGIEALSRGADHCTFLDVNRSAIRTIHENLELTDFTERSSVIRTDSLAYLNQNPLNGYEYVYVAPPQYKEMWQKAVSLIDRRPDWMYPDGVVIVQIDPKEHDELALKHLVLYDQRTYGQTMLCFYERPGE